MSKYKEIMQAKDIKQKTVLVAVTKADSRVDKSLLSKIVNDVCLPTPTQFDAICKSLDCDVDDIYEPNEITLGKKSTTTNKKTAKSQQRRQNQEFYNLTVEIPRELTERVFAPDSLRKLGFLSKSDLVRQMIVKLDKKLAKAKKIADNANTSSATDNTKK